MGEKKTPEIRRRSSEAKGKQTFCLFVCLFVFVLFLFLFCFVLFSKGCLQISESTEGEGRRRDLVDEVGLVCLLLACLTSQQYASVSQGWIAQTCSRAATPR